MNRKIDFPCKMQPKNLGLRCMNPSHCETCGWNPAEAKRRREETIEKEKEKNND